MTYAFNVVAHDLVAEEAGHASVKFAHPVVLAVEASAPIRAVYALGVLVSV